MRRKPCAGVQLQEAMHMFVCGVICCLHVFHPIYLSVYLAMYLSLSIYRSITLSLPAFSVCRRLRQWVRIFVPFAQCQSGTGLPRRGRLAGSLGQAGEIGQISARLRVHRSPQPAILPTSVAVFPFIVELLYC